MDSRLCVRRSQGVLHPTHLGQLEVAVLGLQEEGADGVDLKGADSVELGGHGARQHCQPIVDLVAPQPPQLVHQVSRLWPPGAAGPCLTLK